MAVKTKTRPSITDARLAFSRRYLDRSRGVYSVSLGRADDGELCLWVSGSASALKRLPAEFQGVRVMHRVGAPGVIGLAHR